MNVADLRSAHHMLEVLGNGNAVLHTIPIGATTYVSFSEGGRYNRGLLTVGEDRMPAVPVQVSMQRGHKGVVEVSRGDAVKLVAGLNGDKEVLVNASLFSQSMSVGARVLNPQPSRGVRVRIRPLHQPTA